MAKPGNPDRPGLLGMRHIALFVPSDRFEQTTSFYRDAIGMGVDWEPDPDNLYLSSGADNVAIHRSERSIDHERSPLDHLGFLVPSADTVQRWYDLLAPQAQELGIELVTEVKQHRDGATSFYLHDPAGNKVQIIHIPSVSS